MPGEALDLGLRPIIRPYRDTDIDVVIGTWIHSYEKHAPATPAYKAGQRKLIHRLIASPWTRIMVAASSEYDDAVLGWACAEDNVLHYCHVKDPFRRLGIAKDLMKALNLNMDTVSYTHETRAGRVIMQRFKGAVYDPWLLTR